MVKICRVHKNAAGNRPSHVTQAAQMVNMKDACIMNVYPERIDLILFPHSENRRAKTNVTRGNSLKSAVRQ